MTQQQHTFSFADLLLSNAEAYATLGSMFYNEHSGGKSQGDGFFLDSLAGPLDNGVGELKDSSNGMECPSSLLFSPFKNASEALLMLEDVNDFNNQKLPFGYSYIMTEEQNYDPIEIQQVCPSEILAHINVHITEDESNDGSNTDVSTYEEAEKPRSMKKTTKFRKSPNKKMKKLPEMTEEQPALNYQKPPYSYATLISKALQESETKKLTLSEIYEWIKTNFPYYRTAEAAWQVSIKFNNRIQLDIISA